MTAIYDIMCVMHKYYTQLSHNLLVSAEVHYKSEKKH